MSFSATDASGAAYMAVYLVAAELLGSSKALARASVVAEDDIERSYRRPSLPKDWPRFEAVSFTAKSETAPILVGDVRAEDALIAEIAEYADLSAGWDGYDAAAPSRASLRHASRFARVLAGQGLEITSSLHSDGTVILEVGNEGSLRFLADGRIAFAFDGGLRGTVMFDGYNIPDELRFALIA